MLDDRFQLTLGVRRQFIESRNYNAAGSVSSRYNTNATTPLLGVVVNPWEDVSLYYNYVEGLSKDDAASGTASNARAMSPKLRAADDFPRHGTECNRP